MKRKYNYRICINGMCKSGLSLQYDYGHTKNITFSIKEKCVSFLFQMTVQKKPEEILGNLLFRDALKKALLLHTALYGCYLELKTLEIQTDTEKLTMQNGDENFPKIYTLLPNNAVDLPKSWKNPEFLTFLLQICKSKGERNQRYSGIESFLAAQSRVFEIDRFTNLWTAMNALYSYTALRCRVYPESVKFKCAQTSVRDQEKNKPRHCFC